MKYLLFLLLLLPLVAASSMDILAVKETSAGLMGSEASLTLEIQPGSSRVFIETSPLTKIDTQISARVAQQVACSLAQVDCSNYDFIYTITSSSPLVGGPSAGSAMAILTVADLLNLELNGDVTITGTIGSGGIIGPVGGIKEKIEVAKQEGKTLVLIPEGSSIEELNLSVDIPTFADSLDISVKEVSTLSEALPYFIDYEPKIYSLNEDEEYDLIMSKIAEDLCSGVNQSIWVNYSNSEDYYTASSKCFSQSIRTRSEEFSSFSGSELKDATYDLYSRISKFRMFLNNQSLNSFNDLQTMMIVKERLRDTEENINSSNLAYAYERFDSAVAWSKFFNRTDNKKINIDLKSACYAKISQAQERVQYIEFLAPQISISLETPFDYINEEDYASCIYSASLIKAEADSIISQTSSSNTEELAKIRITVAEQIIAREQSRGNFPLAGYSYLQYSQSLLEENPEASLLYSHYAIELSDFDLYFPQNSPLKVPQNYNFLIIYIVGLFSGIVIIYMVRG